MSVPSRHSGDVQDTLYFLDGINLICRRMERRRFQRKEEDAEKRIYASRTEDRAFAVTLSRDGV